MLSAPYCLPAKTFYILCSLGSAQGGLSTEVAHQILCIVLADLDAMIGLQDSLDIETVYTMRIGMGCCPNEGLGFYPATTPHMRVG